MKGVHQEGEELVYVLFVLTETLICSETFRIFCEKTKGAHPEGVEFIYLYLNCRASLRMPRAPRSFRLFWAYENTGIYRTGATGRSKWPLGPAQVPPERSK